MDIVECVALLSLLLEAGTKVHIAFRSWPDKALILLFFISLASCGEDSFNHMQFTSQFGDCNNKCTATLDRVT